MAVWWRPWKGGVGGASTAARQVLDRDSTVVVFTVPAQRLREMDVAAGPCVALRGSGEVLCSPLSQDRGETPRQTAALYTVLTGRPADGVLIEVARSGAGVLYRCSAEFVEAMASANELGVRLADQDEAAGDDELAGFAAKWADYDRAWLAVGDWPAEVVSTRNRLTRLGWARVARDKSQPLYCWFGPAVPQLVVRAYG